jgi:hypothetical protein
MANKTLTDFISDSLEHGQKRDAIQKALTDAGWQSDEVKDAMSVYADIDFPVAVPKPRPYLPARVAFLYLLYFILLAIVSFSLGNILVAIIENLFPMPGQTRSWEITRNERQIRAGISGLVVAAPIFFFLARKLAAKREKTPELKRSHVRKWLTYLTLVIAGSTLVGDAISLVYNLLDGEMTTRFFLKSLVVAVIAGGIFIYFIKDAERGDEGEGK